jgi:hypothetical protein
MLKKEDVSQFNLRMPAAALREINKAAALEGKSTADYLRIAGIMAACHTFREVPLTTFLATRENMTSERARSLGMIPVAAVGGKWSGEVRVQIGKNGFFNDQAGGIWVLTAEGLKLVMGFDPAEEAERLAVFSKLRKLESRSPFVVIRRFSGYVVQSEEGYASEEHLMGEGQILFADPDFWRGKKWEGEEVVQFYCGMSRFYVIRQTFLNSTQRTSVRA